MTLPKGILRNHRVRVGECEEDTPLAPKKGLRNKNKTEKFNAGTKSLTSEHKEREKEKNTERYGLSIENFHLLWKQSKPAST